MASIKDYVRTTGQNLYGPNDPIAVEAAIIEARKLHRLLTYQDARDRPSFPETSDDDRSFLPPMFWHPRTVIERPSRPSRLDDFLRAVRQRTGNPASAKLVNKILSLWTSANSLLLLHRFTSENHHYLFRDILPDGSNLDTNAIDPRPFRDEWRARRGWIRLLHTRGVFPWSSDIAQSFVDIYLVFRVLLETEIYRCQGGTNDQDYVQQGDPHYWTVDWIPFSRGIILDMWHQIADIPYDFIESRWTRRIVAAPISESNPRHNVLQAARNRLAEDIHDEAQDSNNSDSDWLARNMDDAQINETLTVMLSRFREMIEGNRFERLLLDLLAREDSFELQLTEEHVEDKLINKQIIAIDEGRLLAMRNPQAPERAWTPQVLTTLSKTNTTRALPGKDIQEYIHLVTKRISLTNRQRRNFRLIRDWAGGRPWLKIFQLYDGDKPGNEWLVEAGKQFNGLLGSDPRPQAMRTSYEDVSGKLWGFKPLVVSEGNRVGTCTLCSLPCTGGDELTVDPPNLDHTVAILPCGSNHHFHLNCVFEFWDQPGRYLFNCPICGRAPELAHEKYGVKTNVDDFVHNVFGYKPDPSLNIPIDKSAPDASQASRDSFYNIPPISAGFRTGPQASPTPDSKTANLARDYWLRENMHQVCYETARSRTQEDPMMIPFRDPFHTAPGFRANRLYTAGSDLTDNLPTRFRTSDLEVLLMGAQRTVDAVVKPFQARFWQNHSRGLLEGGGAPGTRYSLEQEVGWVRGQRRKRDAKRRMEIRAAGRGLGANRNVGPRGPRGAGVGL